MPPLETDSLHALQSAVAGYDREQLLSSSGYLAGMAAVRVAEQLSPAIQSAPAAATEAI